MFHVEHDPTTPAQRAAAWVGHPLGVPQLDTLSRYVEWLRTEAIPAGGLGPGESSRLWDRHVADSLTFAAGGAPPSGTALDVGSGAGLPGIPLAILLPHVRFTLLDRSVRRCDLLSRAVRILDLPNVRVDHADVDAIVDRFDLVTLRASLPLPLTIRSAPGLLAPGGTAVYGLSRRLGGAAADRADLHEATAAGWKLVEVPPEVLDSPAALLRMTAPPSAGGTDAVA
jgi:16S rRNA (guanine(527)-N(7))-methyltransferase RsmG